MTSPRLQLSPSDLRRLFSSERLSTYIDYCGGDLAAAVEMYRWNSAITAAFWEPIGHLEVALRNTLDERLAARHSRLGRRGSWLDDPEEELSSRARLDIAGARDRVRQKGKRASDGQTISELSFGFWRFLITKKFTGLWPDLASGFPHAPDRQLGTVERQVAHLHVFRNRLAHHQRVWSHAPEERYEDLLILAGYIDPALPVWIAATSKVPQTLRARPDAPAHAR
jgi:hypothetical protein